jgi:lipopolysaccharide transport system ATP-binding protein
MDGEVVIRARDLGKRYRIDAARPAYGTLRDALAARFRPGARAARRREDFWALRGASFDVRRGEVLGVIGRNGAGKSTLLKILSRITPPTEGRAELRGRVGSLLEVGTGFHPELTGRENVYFNGSVLGMTRREIRARFDEIVAFAEIERFLDTPVKRYSTGMYVRLAFAVAAHMETEILLVDEVLSVGDAAFRRKCLGKMGEVSRGGRTVLFISHNLVALRNLCNRCLWLSEGRTTAVGNAAEVADAYLKEAFAAPDADDLADVIRALPPDPAIRMEAITARQDGRPAGVVFNGRPVEVEIAYTVLARTAGLRVYFDLIDDDETILVRSFHDDDEDAMPIVEPGRYVSVATIPGNFLAARRYALVVRGTIHNVRTCTGGGVKIPLTVEATSGVNRAYPEDPVRARLQPTIPWRTRRMD